MKLDHLRFIYDAVFFDDLCLYSYFSQTWFTCPYFTCISDFVYILATWHCKSFMVSVYTLLGKSKKNNKVCCQVGNHKKDTFLGILDICIFYVRPWVNLKHVRFRIPLGCHTCNLFVTMVIENEYNLALKLNLPKWGQKHAMFVSSNTPSIRGMWL